MASWILLWPVLAFLNGPLLPLLIRIGIELAIGLAAPRFLPLLVVLHRVASLISEKYLSETDKVLLAEITELLSTPRGRMVAPVQETLKVPSALITAL